MSIDPRKRSEHRRHRRARRDLAPAELDILGHDADGAGDRRIVAQHLLDGAGDERRMLLQQRVLRRVSQQVEQAVGEEVGRGFVSGEQQQDAVRHHLVLAQHVAALLGREQHAEHVLLSGSAAPP